MNEQNNTHELENVDDLVESSTHGLANINELIEAQAQLYNDVLAGRVKHYIAKEASNAAGKILFACKVQLVYAQLRGELPNIGFLNSGIGKTIDVPAQPIPSKGITEPKRAVAKLRP